MADPATIPDVIDRLRRIGEELPADDGLGVFDRMYLDVTRTVDERLRGASGFADPAFMGDLDVRFAGLWLAAYDAASAGRAVPKAWAPLVEQRRSRCLAIQFALSGMNAHIEHDLPLAVVETCLARGVSPLRPSVRADYDAVNRLLASVETGIRRSFLAEHGQRLDDRIGPLAHVLSSWSIDKARDLAWVSVESLWALRRSRGLSERYREALAHSVGMTSRYLLTPTGA
jgi:hypothetical protein